MLYKPATFSARWAHYEYQAKALLMALPGRLRAWAGTRDDVRRLRGLDDRLLADLGIERSEIAARVRGER